MASNRSRSNRSVGNKLNNLDSRVSRGEKGTNNPHLSPEVIEEAHLTDGAVAESKLADRAITETKIARGAVGTEHLGVVNAITADSGLTLKPGPDGGFIVIDGPEYVAPAVGSGDLYALAFNENNQVVVSTTGVGGGDGIAAMPAGSIQAWPSNTVPDGWLMCDGAAVSRTTYAALFNAIGTTFGVGDGTTTFNVPDIKGRTIVGRNASEAEFDTLGETGGAKTHTLTSAQIPAHSHPNALSGTTTFASSSHSHGSGSYGAAIGATNGNIFAIGYVAGGVVSGGPGTSTYGITGGNAAGQGFNHYTPVYGSSSGPSATGTVSINNADNTGGGGAHNNLQPYITLNYIIKHMVADGMQGPQGIQGEPGDAASVTVGTTTTGAAGSIAAVSNAGTSSAAVLNFTIPRGDTGATGATGSQGPAGTVAVGSTSTGAEGTNAAVTNSGTSTNAILEFVIPRGNAATVSVGTTTTGAPGTDAEVTNSGNGSNAVFDFVIPEGIGATVDVGTVTTVTEDDPAAVTNSGTTVDAILDFELPQGATGNNAGVKYAFSTTVTDADPGNGYIRFNNANPALATYIYIDNLDATGASQTAWYDMWDNSTSTNKGYITLSQFRTDSTAVFYVNNTVTNASGYYKIPVTYVSGTLPANGAACFLNFSLSGNIGNEAPAGGDAGQILSKATGADYDFVWIDNYADWTSQVKHEVKAGVALTKGQAVYVTTADGTNMIVGKASNASEATSSKTMGLIMQDLAINGKGYVLTEGLLSGLNTSLATVGDPVWLGTNGNLIYGLTNKPVAPAHLVFIGVVTRVNLNNGEIWVKVQNGFELNELHDVLITNPTNGQALAFDEASGLWINTTPATTLDSLTDVVLADPLEPGQALTYTVGATRTNLMTNPNFEVNSAYGTNNLTVVRGSTESFYTGTKSWKFTTGGGSFSDFAVGVPSLTGSTTYTLSMWIKATAGTLVSARAQTWTTAYGRFDTQISPAFTMTGNWQRIYHTWTTASDIIDGEMGFIIDPLVGTVVGFIDAMLLEVSPTLGSYFDGSTSGGSWTGTANASSSTIAGDGVWVNATPASTLDDLTDVTLTGPLVDKQVLKYDDATSQWINAVATGGVTVSATAPAEPYPGDAWYDSTDGSMYVYYDDGVGSPSAQWVEVKSTAVPTNFSGVEARVTTAENDIVALESDVATLQSTQILTSNVNTFTAQQNFSSSGTYISGTSGQVVARPSTNTQIPMVVQGAASQSADLQQWLSSSGTVLAEIDSLGRITQGAIPAFSVGGTGTQSWSGGAAPAKVVMQGAVFTNRGGHYSTTNSRFTAPVAGVYEFHMSSCVTTNATGPEIWVYKNGSVVHSTLAIGYDAFYNTFGSTIVLDLSVNDFVEMYIHNNNSTSFTIDRGRSMFSGFLIG